MRRLTKRPVPRSSEGGSRKAGKRGENQAEKVGMDNEAVNRLAKRVRKIEMTLDRRIRTEASLTRRVERMEINMETMRRKGREVKEKLDHLIDEVGSNEVRSREVESKSDLISEVESGPQAEVGSGHLVWINNLPGEWFWSGPGSDERNNSPKIRNGPKRTTKNYDMK